MAEESLIRNLVVETLRKIVGDTGETLYESVCESYSINPEEPRYEDIPKLGKGLVEVLKPYGEERIKIFLKTMRQIQMILDEEKTKPEIIEELLLYIGDLFLVIGDFNEALTNYFEAANIATNTGNKVILARAIRRVGDVYGARGDYAAARAKYEEAEGLSKGIDDIDGVVESQREIAEIEWKQGKLRQAKERMKQVIELSEKVKNAALKSKIFLTFSRIYLYQGEINVALQYLQNALKIARETRDPFEICRIYNTFGVFYYTVEDYAKAAEYFQETVKLGRSMGDVLIYSYGLINLGSCSINLSKLDEAEKLLEEGMKLITKLENKYALGILYSIFGKFHAAKRNWDLAKHSFSNAITILQELGLEFNLAWAYVYIAQMHIDKGEPGIGITYLEKARAIFEKLNNTYLAERFRKKAQEIAKSE
ncbi:MAG: tetratricopeptide repeat protein [Thermoplasmata archaeon]